MKKVLSLFLTVSLLCTLVPTVFADAESTASEPIRVAITADVPLDGSGTTSYGEKNIGTTPDMLFRRPQAGSAYPTPLLFKTDFSGLELPEGKVIEKVEFFMYSISEQSGCTGYTADIDIYNASTDWEETTTVLLDWCDDQRDTADLMEPDMLFKNPDDLYYADFTSTPDASYRTTFTEIKAGTGNSELISFDITKAFKAAYPSGVVAEGDEFAWITDIRKCDAYRYMCIASKEHTNSELHPYLEITLSEKPSMYVSDSKTPANPEAVFELTTSNAIESYSVTVNGAPVVEGVSVDTNKITLDYDWVLGEKYTVVVNATDTFGQSIPEQTYTFTITDSYIFPITHDTYIFGGNDYLDKTPGTYGEEIHGELDHILLMSKSEHTHRGFGILKTDALSGLKAQLDSGKIIDKVELQTYIAPGSIAVTSQMKFFPASSNWDESTMNMIKWCTEAYSPLLIRGVDVHGVLDENEIPADTYTHDYPAVSEGYVPMTYDITNTFNKAFESGLTDESIFSFMMARDDHSAYNYILFSSSEAEGYEPVIKVTLKEKKYETESTTDFTGNAYFITSSGSKTTSGGGESAYYSLAEGISQSVVAYPMPLPEVPEGKFLESFKLRFREAHSQPQRDYSAYINMYKFIPENSVDLSTLTFSDVADYAVKENRTGSVSATGAYTIYPETQPGEFSAHSYIEYEADLTEYAHECLAAGKTEMIVLMNCDYALKFVGRYGYSAVDSNEVGSKYTASIASNPEITLEVANLDVGGSIVDKAEFKFRTQLADGSENLAKLYKGEEIVEDAVFTLSPSKTKIVLEPITLDENASYKVILESGSEDLFGNVSDADIELASFETITNLTIAVPKIVTADFDAQTTSFADAAEITSAVAAGTQLKAITEITNNTSRNDEIFVVIASYTGNEVKEISSVGVESIGITKKATKIYTSDTITLEEGCDTIKAFVWAENKIVPLSAAKVIELN